MTKLANMLILKEKLMDNFGIYDEVSESQTHFLLPCLPTNKQVFRADVKRGRKRARRADAFFDEERTKQNKAEKLLEFFS